MGRLACQEGDQSQEEVCQAFRGEVLRSREAGLLAYPCLVVDLLEEVYRTP